MFTCNPVSGDPSMVAVNASRARDRGRRWQADAGRLSREQVTGEVVRQTVSDKGVEYVPDAAGRGTVRRQVPAERRGEPCLGEQARRARRRAAHQAHYGSHQDVEWAIARAGTGIVVLQSRPVTTFQAARPRVASAIALVMSKFGAPTRNRHPERGYR